MQPTLAFLLDAQLGDKKVPFLQAVKWVRTFVTRNCREKLNFRKRGSTLAESRLYLSFPAKVIMNGKAKEIMQPLFLVKLWKP